MLIVHGKDAVLNARILNLRSYQMEKSEPIKNRNWREGKGSGFWAERDGKLLKCIMRCPECGAENYALAVATGTCAWCGFDANREPDLSKEGEG